MELYNVFKILLLCAVLDFLPPVADALTCYQCNVFVRGSPWPCDSDRGMRKVEGCRACLKTYTRTYLHNTFHDRLLTSYESRVCVKSRDYAKESGCHAHETDSGYMKRCFCYSDLCNSASSHRIGLSSIATTSLLCAAFFKLFL